ncbi:unnamed protein product [Durusdinium trenchii]|uniref:SET domain-containing protein n=1 Tax=Durusdinium trenchii TaxID=1381693 RepID=A0ABP0QJM0_9DINO
MTGRAGPPSTTPLRSRSVQALREHLERQGAELTRLRVAAVDGSSHAREERGVFAASAISTGEVLAQVPQSCVWSAASARQSAYGQAFAEVFPEGKDKMVFLLDLMAARLDEKHPRHAYASALPKQPPTPMAWPENLRTMLSGTNLGAAVAEEREELEKDFASVMPKLQSARPELFSKDFTFEVFLWAHGMWFSRRYPTALGAIDQPKDYRWQRSSEEEMEEESDGEGVLVPFMDFTNHRSGTKIVWQADVEKVSFITNEGVPAAAEVFNHYGDKSNEDLMLIHGFALLDNLYDTYGLWLTVKVSDEPTAKRRRRAVRTERLGPFHLRRSDARWKEFPSELWQALSAGSAGNEHLRSLSQLLRERLEDFQATQTRDRHFAAGGAAEAGDVDVRIRYIARYRDGQRQVLQDCTKALEEMLAKVSQEAAPAEAAPVSALPE